MMKRALSVCAASGVLLAVAMPADASVQRKTVSANFIHNGYAEAGAGSTDGSVVVVPSWTIITGTTFTAVQYGASGGFPTTTDPGPPVRGANFFAGGPGDAVAAATQQRTLPVALRTAVDAGTAAFTLQGYLGGYTSQDDNATLRVDWLDTHSAVLGSRTIGPVTAEHRTDLTGLKSRKSSGKVPVGTRKMLITLTMTRAEGTYNDGYADNLSLKITTPS